MARSLMGNYEEIQYQCKHHTSHCLIENIYAKAESAVQWLVQSDKGAYFHQPSLTSS